MQSWNITRRITGSEPSRTRLAIKLTASSLIDRKDEGVGSLSVSNRFVAEQDISILEQLCALKSETLTPVDAAE